MMVVRLSDARHTCLSTGASGFKTGERDNRVKVRQRHHSSAVNPGRRGDLPRRPGSWVLTCLSRGVDISVPASVSRRYRQHPAWEAAAFDSLMENPTITDYCREANSNGKHLTDEQLLEELHRLARVTGETPTLAILEDRGRFSETAYYTHFGTWTDALQEAGFTPVSGKSRIDDETLLDDLQRVCELLGRAPSIREYKSKGSYAGHTFEYRFGSWSDALDEAGLAMGSLPGRWAPTGDLIDEMVRVGCQVGRPPTQDDMRESGEFSTGPYKDRFGTWKEALRTCGFPPRYRGGTFHPSTRDRGDYGSNWYTKRREALQRDRWRCQHCGLKEREHREEFGRNLHVHHLVPIRQFETAEDANFLLNLITLCEDCHEQWELEPTPVDADELQQHP